MYEILIKYKVFIKFCFSNQDYIPLSLSLLNRANLLELIQLIEDFYKRILTSHDS